MREGQRQINMTDSQPEGEEHLPPDVAELLQEVEGEVEVAYGHKMRQHRRNLFSSTRSHLRQLLRAGMLNMNIVGF